MAEKNKKKNSPKRELNAVDRRYLKAADILVETGRAKSHSEICISIGIDRSIISKMKSEGRSVTMQQLEATITNYGLNSEYFFYDAKPLFEQAETSKSSGIATNGDNNKVFNVGQGNIEGNVLYEQIADQIVNEAPPELHNKISMLVQETDKIKKLSSNYKEEVAALKTEKSEVEARLQKTNEELHAVKDELLNVFRNR